MMVENANGDAPLAELVTISLSKRFTARSSEVMHQCADTHYFCFLPSRCLEFSNCYNVKLANVRAIYFGLCVCDIANFNFSGLDFGKPQNDLPSLVHIAPSNETNVFDTEASSILQGSML